MSAGRVGGTAFVGATCPPIVAHKHQWGNRETALRYRQMPVDADGGNPRYDLIAHQTMQTTSSFITGDKDTENEQIDTR